MSAGAIKNLTPPPILNCPVDGGKYQIVMEQSGALRIDRYGEPWMGGALGISDAMREQIHKHLTHYRDGR